MVRDTSQEDIIKAIINARSRDGATIDDIATDFLELIGEPWPIFSKTLPEIKSYLEGIHGVYAVAVEGGYYLWFVNSRKMQHVRELIAGQKRNRERNSYLVNTGYINPHNVRSNNYHKPNQPHGQTTCFFKDNYAYRYKRSFHQNHVNQDPKNTSSSSTSALFYDYELVGDDFFLALATAEMGLKYTKKGKIRQCGLCISGQTIRGATKRIESMPTIEKKELIINLGSVDILHGHDLIDMRYDFTELLEVCKRRNLKPIITTLAPLANANHTPETRDKLIAFNNFLLDRYYLQYQILNIWSVMATPCGVTLYDCYQPGSKYVTGSCQPHVLWNRIGRQRVFKHIKQNI